MAFGQSSLCTFSPSTIDKKPKILSPGIALQHFDILYSRISSSSLNTIKLFIIGTLFNYINL